MLTWERVMSSRNQYLDYLAVSNRGTDSDLSDLVAQLNDAIAHATLPGMEENVT